MSLRLMSLMLSHMDSIIQSCINEIQNIKHTIKLPVNKYIDNSDDALNVVTYCCIKDEPCTHIYCQKVQKVLFLYPGIKTSIDKLFEEKQIITYEEIYEILIQVLCGDCHHYHYCTENYILTFLAVITILSLDYKKTSDLETACKNILPKFKSWIITDNGILFNNDF